MIVDKEISCIKALCTELEKYSEIKIVETITSAERAKKAIFRQQPHLLFIDVEMFEMTGIELLRELSISLPSNVCIIIHSAHDKYPIDALRVSAFDYLPKPYHPEELRQIIERVKHRLKSNNIRLEQSDRRLLPDDRKFALQTITGLLILKRSDVIYFQYNNDLRSWQIFLSDNRVSKLRSIITSKEILNISSSFLQVNQNVIINIDYLVSIDMNSRCLFCSPYNNLNITISRRYYSKLKEVLEII